MMTKLFFILSMSSATLSTQAAIQSDRDEKTWSKEYYLDLETHTFLYNKASTPIHIVHLEAILLKGSGWEVDDIYSRFIKLNEILSQCNIEARSLSLKVITPLSPDLLNPEIHEEGILKFLNHFPQSNGIRLFYVARVPYAAGIAFNELLHGLDSPITNTILIAKKYPSYNSNTNTLGPLELSDPEVDAHELIHILANEVHNDSEPNLMNSQIKGAFSHKILASYCQKAIQHPDVEAPKREKWIWNLINKMKY